MIYCNDKVGWNWPRNVSSKENRSIHVDRELNNSEINRTNKKSLTCSGEKG